MKKFFVTLGLAILVLTGCSQSQTKKTTTASSSSSSSVKKEVKNDVINIILNSYKIVDKKCEKPELIKQIIK